jgi:hypothetical protein
LGRSFESPLRSLTEIAADNDVFDVDHGPVSGAMRLRSP